LGKQATGGEQGRRIGRLGLALAEMTNDQANTLRELVRRAAAESPVRPQHAPRCVLVVGSKGGVGATSTALNLACCAQRQGQRVLLVDADGRGADATVLCGQTPRRALAHVLSGQCSVTEVLVPTPEGFALLPAAWNVAPPAWSAGTQTRLLSELFALAGRFDLLIVDGGNARSDINARFWAAAQAVVVVLVADPLALMDAYAAIKVLGAQAPHVPVWSLVNQVDDEELARHVAGRLQHACQRFLGRTIHDGGCLPRCLPEAGPQPTWSFTGQTWQRLCLLSGELLAGSDETEAQRLRRRLLAAAS
jgi:flagellar biosynthesis protein FlhG